MNVQLETIVFEKQKNTADKFNRIGGGFYADVYKFDFKNSDSMIVKVYKSKGLMEKEISFGYWIGV